jgi:peptide/nickel transport system permease protein
MTLRNYVIRRLILIIPTFFLISAIVFTLIHLAPGDPVMVMVSRHGLPQATQDRIREELGLNEPVPVQYAIWVGKLLRGDFGFSYVTGRNVLEWISNKIPATVELILVAEIISVIIAVTLGVIAAVKHYSLTDAVCSVTALVGYSAPSFWIAVIAILVFSMMLKWLPPSGMYTVGVIWGSPLDAFVDHLKHLIMPTSILVLGWTAYLFRMVRSSMLDVLNQDFIMTARAKGVKERVVIYKHALRNALLPVITYLGFSIGFLLGGAAVIENIFDWPGLGEFIVMVASNRDYPALMGITMIISLMVLIANLCADVTYAIVDPRIRYD